MKRVLEFTVVAFVFMTVAFGSGPFQIPIGMAPDVKSESGRVPSYTSLEDPIVNDCRFALSLLDVIKTSDSGVGNVVMSPFSILIAVSAVAEGARGTSASQLLSVLNRSTSDVAAQRFRTRQMLLGTNQPNGNYSLSVANGLYVRKDFEVLPSFLTVMQESYQMGVRTLDFGQSSHARDTINEWIDQATNHTIPELIPPGVVGPLTKLVLVNAIYFNGDWKLPFDKHLTKPRPFEMSEGEFLTVPTMTVRRGYFPYGDFPNYGFEMLELPYKGDEVSMFVILPKKDQNVQKVVRHLRRHPFLLSDPSHYLTSHEFSVEFPKFRIQKKVDLKSILMKMNATEVFNPNRADLSGITGDRSLYVSDAIHEAMIEVNEKGTVAGAATVVDFPHRSLPMKFRVNRPFLYFIRHHSTASILFLGQVTHPQYDTPSTD